MKIFVVNLARSPDRKTAMRQQLADLALSADFITATDGKALSEQEILDFCPDYHLLSMSVSELGCAVSHLRIYQKMVDEHIPFALILEDDVVIDPRCPAILSRLNDNTLLHSSQPMVFFLNKTIEYFDTFKKPLMEPFYLVSVISTVSTYGYIVNRAAARRLLSWLRPVRFVADEWKLFRERGVVKLRAIVPPLIVHSDHGHGGNSTIADRRTDFSTDLDKALHKKPLKVEIKLALWRTFIRTWLKKVHP